LKFLFDINLVNAFIALIDPWRCTFMDFLFMSSVLACSSCSWWFWVCLWTTLWTIIRTFWPILFKHYELQN